jgi:hypothetical protein
LALSARKREQIWRRLDIAPRPGAQKFWLIGLAGRLMTDHTIDLIRSEKDTLPKIAATHERRDHQCI